MEYEDFLNKVDLFTNFQFDSNDYTLIKVEDVKTDTAKAALILLEGYASHEWVPYSVLRCDTDGNIYMANWFYKKNF